MKAACVITLAFSGRGAFTEEERSPLALCIKEVRHASEEVEPPGMIGTDLRRQNVEFSRGRAVLMTDGACRKPSG